MKQRGFGLVEVLVGVGIIAIAFVAIFNVYSAYLRAEIASVQAVKASFLLDEGLEVVRFWRDTSWSGNITPRVNGTPYYFYWTGTVWQATTTVQTIDSLYTRSVVFSAVNRDANDDITTSGGTLDTNTRGFTVTVSWPFNNSAATTTSKQVSSCITNMFSN